MKIAHIVYRCVPGEYDGGVERVVLELADAQAARGAQVDILAYSELRRRDTQTANGVRIRYFGGRKRWGGVVSSPQIMAAIRAERPGYDMLHGHWTFHPLNLEVGRVARALALPAFYHPHGALDPHLFRGIGPSALKKGTYIRLFEVPNLNRAAAVFALSKEERLQLRSIGVTAPIEIISNGISAPIARNAQSGLALRDGLGIAHDAPVLLFLGRIVPKKRVEDIVRAVISARLSHPRMTLLIAGSTEYAPAYAAALRQLIDDAQLGSHVHWLGFLNEARKPSAVSAADIFIHASESEGMAMAILEAMAAGLPTLVTPGCYLEDAAAAGAVLQTLQKPEAIAAGLLRIIDEKGFAAHLAQEGPRYIQEHHSWPALASQVLAAYEAHASRKAGSGTRR